MWRRVALLSANWRAIGGYQSSIISVDGIFALQVPMSSLSSRLYLAYRDKRSVFMHEVCSGFFFSFFSQRFEIKHDVINHLHQVHLLYLLLRAGATYQKPFFFFTFLPFSDCSLTLILNLPLFYE